MKFPITRESLQSWDNNKDSEDLRIEAFIKEFIKEFNKQLMRTLDIIYTQFQQQMHQNPYQKKFVFQQLRNYTMPFQQIRGSCFNGITDIDKYINEFIDKLTDKLKEDFIGCDIIIDPLKTYIIIDWS